MLELHHKDTCFDRHHDVEFPAFTHKFGNGRSVSVQKANKQDVAVVNKMMYDAAQRVQGFAIDEYNVDNMFSRRLLRKVAVIVAKDTRDVILAAVIFGPTSFCRSASTNILGAYMIVNQDHHNRALVGS